MTAATKRAPRKRAPRKRAPAAAKKTVSAAAALAAAGTNGAKSASAAPKPQPKPGDPNFPWAEEYPGEEVFVFTASDGTTVGLTKLGPKRRPKPGRLALLNDKGKAGGVEILWYFLKLASSDASRDVQAELEEEDYAAMSRQWAKFAGIELGE